MDIQALSSVLVPHLQCSFFLVEKTECIFPTTHQSPRQLSEDAPWSICDLVIPPGRSLHCRIFTNVMSQGQEASVTRILKRKIIPEFNEGQFVSRTLKS